MDSFDSEVRLSVFLAVAFPLPAWSGSSWRSDIGRRVANRAWAQSRSEGTRTADADAGAGADAYGIADLRTRSHESMVWDKACAGLLKNFPPQFCAKALVEREGQKRKGSANSPRDGPADMLGSVWARPTARR